MHDQQDAIRTETRTEDQCKEARPVAGDRSVPDFTGSSHLIAAALFVLAGCAVGCLRIFPLAWHFVPIGALALFGSARLRLWQAVSLTFALMALTDLIIWWQKDWRPFDPYVYGSLAITLLLGRLLTRTNSPVRIAGCTLAASVVFFLVTNFGVWLATSVDPATLPAGAAYEWVSDPLYSFPSPHYAANVKGLAACYWLAIAFSRPEAPPLGFFGNLVVCDLFFVGLLFGMHAWLVHRVPAARSLSGATQFRRLT
jgi:hypothetical protein